jgi:hypothetical protein
MKWRCSDGLDARVVVGDDVVLSRDVSHVCCELGLKIKVVELPL